MGFNKNGVSMILVYFTIGIMILIIGTVFIFDLYNEGDVDFGKCRNSIILRSQNIEFSAAGFTFASFKDSFPLECKTSVVEINKGNVNEAEEIIAQKLSECWALFDNGDVSPFPRPTFFEIFEDGLTYSTCVPCSRITFTNEAKEILRSEGTIDIRSGMDNSMQGDKSYYRYLNNSGRKFSAFVNDGSFNLNSPKFSVGADKTSEYRNVENKINGEVASFAGSSVVNLPKLIDVDNGDLIISYGSTISEGYSEFGSYVPYVIYFQVGQDPEPFEESQNNFLGGTGLCEYWEGIPA